MIAALGVDLIWLLMLGMLALLNIVDFDPLMFYLTSYLVDVTGLISYKDTSLSEISDIIEIMSV